MLKPQPRAAAAAAAGGGNTGDSRSAAKRWQVPLAGNCSGQVQGESADLPVHLHETQQRWH
jgi:hypothetical protein